MNGTFYKFSFFKNPLYCLAWNANLGLYTFRSFPKDMRIKIMDKCIDMSYRTGRDPLKENDFFLGCVYFAYALAELNILPNVAHGDARWYPVEKPEWHYHVWASRLDETVAKVRADVLKNHGTVLPDYGSYGGSMEDLLWN